MNSKMKRRLMVVSGIIVIVVVLLLAVVGGKSAARNVTVADAVGGDLGDAKIQVSGNVVDNSFATNDGVLTFDIVDPEGDPNVTLHVSYAGSASSTFGNGVTAICTGRLDGSGVLQCTELVTKCPSKYESGTDALIASALLAYGEEIIDIAVRITGPVVEGTLTAAGSGDVRFVVADTEDSSVTIPVRFDGALSEGITDGTVVVVTGSLSADGSFAATDVAIEG